MYRLFITAPLLFLAFWAHPQSVVTDPGFEFCQPGPVSGCAWNAQYNWIYETGAASPEYDAETGRLGFGIPAEGNKAMVLVARDNALQINYYRVATQGFQGYAGDTVHWKFRVTLCDNSAWASSAVGIEIRGGTFTDRRLHPSPITAKNAWAEVSGQTVLPSNGPYQYLIGSFSDPNAQLVQVGGIVDSAAYAIDDVQIWLNSLSTPIVDPETTTRPDKIMGYFDLSGRPLDEPGAGLTIVRYRSGKAEKWYR